MNKVRDINGFIKLREMYEIAYNELKMERKITLVVVFLSQIDGLGSSPISKYHAIKDNSVAL